ncbi:MAG: thiolase family protein [Burkholderiaceae bacterium]|nr:thiolase family protein [Burkholderiaceae bacterium]MDP3138360.1 thiolase family protein [Burkholderiaceae bacterium]
MSTRAGETLAAISGIGMSEVARPSQKSALTLTVDACLQAIEDAGLDRSRIDGISTYPGIIPDRSGLSEVGVHDIRMALGLQTDWYSGAKETAGQLGAVFNAIAAIAAGFASHVLVFRTITEASARKAQPGATAIGGGAARVGGVHEWTTPFRALSAANWFALYAQRHFHEYGTRPEQMAQIALNARRNAALNPAALYREPLDMAQYMASRMISTPLRLYDCDAPVDASVAVVVSRVEEARNLRNPLIRVEAVGSALHSRDTWYRPQDLTRCADAADMMWSRTSLKPRDVDVAQLYDGFSIHTMLWLEALGFCARGESGPFIEGGQRIALDGELPLNTSGGQLSAGRLHGLGFLHEACVQLWKRGDLRQVKGDPRVAVASAGYGGGFAGCMLVARHD